MLMEVMEVCAVCKSIEELNSEIIHKFVSTRYLKLTELFIYLFEPEYVGINVAESQSETALTLIICLN